MVAGLEDIAHGVCVHLLLDHRQRTRRAVGGDVLGVGDRARQQLLGRDDLLDQPELGGLLGEEDPAGQQQVQRDAPADDARAVSSEMPYSAISPRRANEVVNFAPAAANRTSHISAWVSPMPAQAPLIAAMTGLRSVVNEDADAVRRPAC